MRTFREAVTNVIKHAAASNVEAQMEVTDRAMSLSVVDDGVGIDPSATSGRGLTTMKTRAEELGGSLEVGDHGIALSIPLPTPEPGVSGRHGAR